MRKSRVERRTDETDVVVEIELDGTGSSEIDTPLGFLNHMLTSLSKHSLIDIKIDASGDLDHHVVEDTAICLGDALRKALGDFRGIKRFGYSMVPMDCSLAFAAIDLSNRPYAVVDLMTKGTGIEDMASEDISHFFESLASSLNINIHVRVEYGQNDHHKVEAAFKALALALREAVSRDPKRKDIPSTKGVI
ncbi:MAG: imidazoleglycerol-phosphate dehydratase HisB [Candidatus Bathyarchaeia archaeon]